MGLGTGPFAVKYDVFVFVVLEETTIIVIADDLTLVVTAKHPENMEAYVNDSESSEALLEKGGTKHDL